MDNNILNFWRLLLQQPDLKLYPSPTCLNTPFPVDISEDILGNVYAVANYDEAAHSYTRMASALHNCIDRCFVSQLYGPEDLPDVTVAIICDSDPFGSHHFVYQVQTRELNTNTLINDGLHTFFIDRSCQNSAEEKAWPGLKDALYTIF